MAKEDHDRRGDKAIGMEADILNVLSLSVRAARQNVMACATLLANAGVALDDGAEAIVIDHVLDVEPLLFEAQTMLNAVCILQRKAKQGAFDGF